MKANALNIIVLAVIGLFSLGATARTYVQGGSESSPQTDSVLHSQPKPIVFHHLTMDDGLSHNSEFHVLQDRQGFFWATAINIRRTPHHHPVRRTDLEECYRLGVNAYEVKPVRFIEFVDAVKQTGVFWVLTHQPPSSGARGQ